MEYTGFNLGLCVLTQFKFPQKRYLLIVAGLATITLILCILLYTLLPTRRTSSISRLRSSQSSSTTFAVRLTSTVLTMQPSAVAHFCSNWSAASASAPISSGPAPAALRQFAVLRAALLDAADLMAAGGVHIVDTARLLASANALPHFSLSSGVSPDWHEENNMYQLEENFEVYLRASPFVARNADSAALFFVPQHALHDVHWCSGHMPVAKSDDCAQPPRASHSLRDCMRNATRDYLAPLIEAVRETSHWRARGGRDHFWLFSWDWAANGFSFGDFYAPRLLGNSTYLGYHAGSGGTQRKPGSRAVPALVPNEWTAAATRKVLWGGCEHIIGGGGSKLKGKNLHLASFAGSVLEDRAYSRGIRQDLLAAAKAGNLTSDIVVRVGHLPAQTYQDLLESSTFCLCPPGWAPWSPRIYAAIAAGCLPVVWQVSGFDMDLPFFEMVDWGAFLVRVPEGTPASALPALLRAFSNDEICAMRAALSEWAPYLLWSSSQRLPLLLTLVEAWRAEREARERGAVSTGI